MAERNAHHAKDLATLFECIRNNRQDEALDLIASMDCRTLNHLVEVKDYYFMTALIFAVEQDQPRVVSALLEKGVDPNEGHGVCSNGQFIWKTSPLLTALMMGKDISILYMLLKKGADPLFGSENAKQLIALDGLQHDTDLPYIPFTFALKFCGFFFDHVLQYTNVFTKFGPDKRTCLCDAVETYFGKVKAFHFMQKIRVECCVQETRIA